MIENYYMDTFILQKPMETNGDFGQIKKTFSDLITFKGYLEVEGGNRNFYGNSYETYIESILFCNILLDIETNYRISFNNKYYRIANIKNIKNHHMEIDLTMIEGDSK